MNDIEFIATYALKGYAGVPCGSFERTQCNTLSAHSAAEFNSSPGRWQHVWLVAIVPPERWGKMDRNDCHTAWENFKTLISSLHHSKNYACSFSLIDFLFYFNVVFYLSDLVLPSTGCKSQLFHR
jgi:hypothetical protein